MEAMEALMEAVEDFDAMNVVEAFMGMIEASMKVVEASMEVMKSSMHGSSGRFHGSDGSFHWKWKLPWKWKWKWNLPWKLPSTFTKSIRNAEGRLNATKTKIGRMFVDVVDVLYVGCWM